MVHRNALRHSFAFNGFVQAHQIYIRIHFSLTMGDFHQQVHKVELHASNHQLCCSRDYHPSLEQRRQFFEIRQNLQTMDSCGLTNAVCCADNYLY